MHLSYFAQILAADSKATTIKSAAMTALKIPRRRIFIADDHAVFRRCLIRLLHSSPDLDVVGDAEDGLQAVELVVLLHPDVVVMDVDMPLMNGIEATRHIKKALPEVRILGLSMHDHEDIAAQMLSAGAAGYFVKDGPIEKLLSAIHA